MVSTRILVPVFGALAAYAIPTGSLVARSVSPLSSSQISAYTPYSYYASAGYCSPANTLAWNCGVNCNANPGFKPVASGGDGNGVQFWYVGYDPNLKTVIVGHQGTNPSQFLSVLTDASFFLQSLDATLFPGVSSSVQVHNGFATEQAKTAAPVLAAVKTTMSKFATTKVTIVGHSLGAALALLDSVYLPLHLPTGTTFKTVGFGMPRVGNQAFADYVDSHLTLNHVNNKKDDVPIVPGRFLGFVHPAGEVHITESNTWAACSGQDNTDVQCSTGDVTSILVGNLVDHLGPYNGIHMGCS